MGYADFRRPGSGGPAIERFIRSRSAIDAATKIPSNVTNPLNPLPKPFPFGLYKLGLFATVFFEGIDAGATAKSDLASVEAFLGYKPTAPVTVELGTPQNFTGGQIPGQLYSIRAYWKWTGETTEQVNAQFTSGIPGKITQIQTFGSTNASACTYRVFFDSPNNPRSADSQFIIQQFGKTFNMASWRYEAVNVTNGQSPDAGGNPAPTGTVTAPAVSEIQAFKTPGEVSPNNPAAPSAPKTKPGEEKKIGIPPIPEINPTSDPNNYPELNPTPTFNPDPSTNPDTNLIPGQLAPIVTPSINPGKTTSFIPGALPKPATKPLLPGTTRNTRFLPPADRNIVTIKEPYITPIKKEEPKVAPLPLPIPLPSIPAKLDCQELLDCLEGIIGSGPSTEIASLPIYSCNLETGEIETEQIIIQVPVNSSAYLELLFENFQPLIAATCPEVINLTSTFISATSSFYEQTDPDIVYVKLEIVELPIDRKTIPAGQIKDYTYFSGWFSWLKNGIKANQEESINKKEQIFFKPEDCNGFRYYCLYGATIACTIYKKA